MFMETPPIKLNARLKDRYGVLVQQHSASAHPLASGLRALSAGGQAVAATQPARRFFKNRAVTLSALRQPPQEHTRQPI